MAQIIRATTPTIKFKFKTINVSTITKAIMTIKQNGIIVLEKDLSAATVGSDTIEWELTQAETLALGRTPVVITCDWVLNTGKRGRANVLDAQIGEPGKDEVI